MTEQALKQAIVALGRKCAVASDRSWYRWSFPEKAWTALAFPGKPDLPDARFERTVAMKQALSEAYSKADAAARERLVRFFVQEWGGVRGHSDETIRSYAAARPEQLIARGRAGVASWSKALNLRHPERFPIYDSRVALAVHVLAGEAGVAPPALPLVPSRDAERDRRVRARFGLGGRRCPGFYDRYRTVLSAAAADLRVSPQVVEMLLFAKGPGLWDTFAGAAR